MLNQEIVKAIQTVVKEQIDTALNKAKPGNIILYKSSGDAVGGGQPHNNMPFYKNVNIWERTT